MMEKEEQLDTLRLVQSWGPGTAVLWLKGGLLNRGHNSGCQGWVWGRGAEGELLMQGCRASAT